MAALRHLRSDRPFVAWLVQRNNRRRREAADVVPEEPTNVIIHRGLLRDANVGDVIQMTLSLAPTGADEAVIWSVTNGGLFDGNELTLVNEGSTTVTVTSVRNQTITDSFTFKTLPENTTMKRLVMDGPDVNEATAGSIWTLSATPVGFTPNEQGVLWSLDAEEDGHGYISVSDDGHVSFLQPIDKALGVYAIAFDENGESYQGVWWVYRILPRGV